MNIECKCETCGGITKFFNYKGERTFNCSYCNGIRDIPYGRIYEYNNLKKNEEKPFKSCNDIVKNNYKPITLKTNLKTTYEEKQNYWESILFALKIFGLILIPIIIILICFNY